MRRSTRRAVRRVVGIGLAAAAAVYLLFLVVVNSMLWSGAIASLTSRSSEDTIVNIDHGFAWVLWPTRVHVEDFHMVLDTHKFQLELDIPEGVLDVTLWELVLKNFHAEEIEADGVRAILRTKHRPDSSAMDRMQDYGQIRGAPLPLILAPEPPPKPKDQKLLVDIDQVHASVDQLWFNEFKIEMNGHLSGSLRSISDYVLEVERARLDFESARVSVGGTESARDLEGHVELQIAPYHQQDEQSVARDATVGAVAAAQIVDIGFANAYLPGGFSLDQGAGPLQLDARLERGTLVPGSFADYETDALTMSKGDLSASAALDVHASVVPRVQAPAGRATQVEATISSLQLGQDAGKIDRAHARVLFGQASLQGAWPIVATSGVIKGLKLDELTALQGLRATPGRKDAKRGQKGSVLGGSVSAELSWHSTKPQHVQGRASGQARNLKLKLDRSRVKMSAKAKSDFTLHLDTKTLEIDDLQGRIEDLDLRTPQGSTDDHWIRVDHLQMKWQIPEEQMGAIVWAKMENLRPVFAYAKNASNLMTEIPDVIEDPVTMHLEFRRDGKKKVLQLMEVSKDILDVRGELYLTGKTRGALLFQSIDLGVAFGGPEGTEFELGADPAWLREHTQGLPNVDPSFSDPPHEGSSKQRDQQAGSGGA